MHALLTETNLICTVNKQILSSIGEGDSIELKFYDKISNEARIPLSTTLLLVLGKDTNRYEIIELSSHSTTSGITTAIVKTRNLKWSGSTLETAGAVTFIHPEGEEGGTVDIHYFISGAYSVLAGLLSTGGNVFNMGDGFNDTAEIQADGTGFLRILKTPATLTGGTNALATVADWKLVTDGEFSITIDGVARDITGIDFSGCGDMIQVASTLQTAIRAVTSGSEIVDWDTDHFIIKSEDWTTVASAITETSTYGAGAGTDISGAGASNYLDCDSGNGVVTAFSLPKAQYNNGTGWTNIDTAAPANITTRATTVAGANNGEIFRNTDDNNSLYWKDHGGSSLKIVDDTLELIPAASIETLKDITSSVTEINQLAGTTNIGEANTFFGATDMSGAEAETLTDGSDASSLHTHASEGYLTGFGSWANATQGSPTQATSDGFIVLYANGSSTSGVFTCKTDSANPPTTIRARAFGVSGNPSGCSAMTPVKSGDYYLIETTGDITTKAAYFIPLS